MTYKYYEVRRQIYENCSDKELSKNRTLDETKRLFKKDFWALMILFLTSLVLLITMVFLYPTKPYFLLPMIGLLISSFLLEFKDEKLYNQAERKKELLEFSQQYNDYITNIKKVLSNCGLTKKHHLKSLKTECENSLSVQYKRYRTANNKIYDMLIGIPLGALISSLIYQNNENIISEIIGIIAFGSIIIVLLKVYRIIRYYSDGYFKDQYLLNILNELEYAFDE